MSYTPGPWSLTNPADPGDSSIRGSDGELVISGEYDGYMVPFAARDGEEAADNARLAVAAPELLAALLDLYAATPDNHGGPLGVACMNARSLVVRITGKTPQQIFDDQNGTASSS